MEFFQSFDLIKSIEFIAVITALIYVILAAKSNYWCFVFGLISSAIYCYICFNLKFYFDVGINFFYVIMSFYGWFAWKNNSAENHKKPITKLALKEIGIWILLGAVLSILLASMADRFTEASLPYLDSFTTIFALIATWFVVRRKLENWLFWIAIDLVASGMYIYKELHLTAALFLLYTGISIYGYSSWKNEMKDA